MNILPVFVCCVFVVLNFTLLLNAEVIAIGPDDDRETFKDRELTSSHPIGNGGIEGAIVEAYPIDACVNISGPPDISNSSFDWFVLISGDNCDCDMKIYNAQNAGFTAAIIYNTNQKCHLKRKQPHHVLPFPNTSAVVIDLMGGLCISERFLYTIDERCRIVIFSNNSFNILNFLIILVMVGGIFILMMLLFMIIKCIQQTRQRQNNRLSSRHLKQLMSLRFKKGDPYDTCAICLEDYKERDRLRVLPCSHGYHCKCIDPWLTNNKRTCPICKQKVVLSGIHSDGDTDSDTEGRAETAPLLQSRVINVRNGAFTTGIRNPALLFQSNNSDLRYGSGETTSRDVASDAFDETSEDEVGSQFSRVTVSPQPFQPSIQNLAVPCNSLNSNDGVVQAAVNPFDIRIHVNDDNFLRDHSSPSYNDCESQCSKQPNHKRPYV